MTSASNDHGARVTPAGWGTVALASAFLVAGVNTGANLLFLLAGLLLGAVALNRLLVGRQSSACRVTVRAPETVERHALTAVRLRVEPAGRGTGLPLAITVPLPGRARPGALAVQLDGLDRPVEAAFEVAFGRTGRWTLDRVEVASLAPFGLARGARSVPGAPRSWSSRLCAPCCRGPCRRAERRWWGAARATPPAATPSAGCGTTATATTRARSTGASPPAAATWSSRSSSARRLATRWWSWRSRPAPRRPAKRRRSWPPR